MQGEEVEKSSVQSSPRTVGGIGVKQKLKQSASSIFAETPVLFAYLYGSFAKGVTHPFSDLDVGIFVEGLDTKACLNLELSLSLLLMKVSNTWCNPKFGS